MYFIRTIILSSGENITWAEGRTNDTHDSSRKRPHSPTKSNIPPLHWQFGSSGWNTAGAFLCHGRISISTTNYRMWIDIYFSFHRINLHQLPFFGNWCSSCVYSVPGMLFRILNMDTRSISQCLPLVFIRHYFLWAFWHRTYKVFLLRGCNYRYTIII
jgi:hypothetical protein